VAGHWSWYSRHPQHETDNDQHAANPHEGPHSEQAHDQEDQAEQNHVCLLLSVEYLVDEAVDHRAPTFLHAGAVNALVGAAAAVGMVAGMAGPVNSLGELRSRIDSGGHN